MYLSPKLLECWMRTPWCKVCTCSCSLLSYSGSSHKWHSHNYSNISNQTHWRWIFVQHKYQSILRVISWDPSTCITYSSTLGLELVTAKSAWWQLSTRVLCPRKLRKKIFSFCILRLVSLLQFFHVHTVEAIQYNRIILQNSEYMLTVCA